MIHKKRKFARDREPSPGVRHALTRTCIALALCATALSVSAQQRRQKPETRGARPGWSLSWSDEFDRPEGSGVDRAKWVTETGGGGWGNRELQTYTDRTKNARIEGGNLVIHTLRERFTGTDNITRDYTSARIKTQGKFEQTYGRFEARIKVARGQGIWSAFWLLGADITTKGWAECGEIDIMEVIGREPSKAFGTLHGPGYSGANALPSTLVLPDGKKLADAFHVYAVEWEPQAIRWYLDEELYATKTPADVPAGKRWVYDHPFFILLNVAVGGDFPGSPDATSTYPQTMKVDYVRVYRRNEATRPSLRRSLMPYVLR